MNIIKFHAKTKKVYEKVTKSLCETKKLVLQVRNLRVYYIVEVCSLFIVHSLLPVPLFLIP